MSPTKWDKVGQSHFYWCTICTDMSNYTKLFESILDSTIWGESNTTRIVWITMLAMADRHGIVEASVPGLARRALVTIEDVEAALGVLQAPDPYSRTKEFEGRRIEPIDGGWFLINHAAHRERANIEDRRAKEADRKRRQRAARAEREKVVPQNVPLNGDMSQGVPKCPKMSRQAEAEAEAEAEASPKTNNKRKPKPALGGSGGNGKKTAKGNLPLSTTTPVRQLLGRSPTEDEPLPEVVDEMFAEFCAAYPESQRGKPGKAEARRAFVLLVYKGVSPHDLVAGAKGYRKALEAADRIGSQYVAMMTTFLNQGRYEDHIGGESGVVKMASGTREAMDAKAAELVRKGRDALRARIAGSPGAGV